MAKVKAGFIGIMSRDGDKWEQLEKAAKIGFKGTENAEMYLRGADGNIDPENVKRFKDLGMEAITVSAFNGPTLAATGAEGMIKRAQAIGVNRAVIFHGAGYFAKGGKVITYDEVMNEIEMFQDISSKLKKEGIKLGYHNHDHEFKIKFTNDMTIMDMILTYAPDMYMELDVGWATYAGMNTVDFMYRHADRFSAVHFKDFIPQKSPVMAAVPMLEKGKLYPMPCFSSIGSGGIDVYGLLKACSDLGIDYAICEQDFMHVLTPMEVLQKNYLVMKETGFVE